MRALRSWPGLLGTLALAALPARAGAQAVGSEFQINPYTTDLRLHTLIWSAESFAWDASGNFVVVSNSISQNDDREISGQRYDSTGAAQGSEFRVNSYTTGVQALPSVASDASGNFVVVWEGRDGQDGDGYGIFGQRYDNAGGPLGGEFRVNSYTTNNQRRPWAASDASGNFVVVWFSTGQDGSDHGIFGQRYDSGGVAQGAEFRINSYTTGAQSAPSVASDASGNFVVAWNSKYQDGSFWGVFGQRYGSGGVAQGDEFQINSYTTRNQETPSVRATGDNQFVVVWDSVGQDRGRNGVFGRRFDFSGSAQTRRSGSSSTATTTASTKN